MQKNNAAKKTRRVDARITELEKEMLEAVAKTEGLSESETVRFIIRLVARIYGFLPAVIDCPDCGSQQIEQTADDL